MKLGRYLLLLAFFQYFAYADENNTDRYTLPPSKAYIQPCQKEALLRHPGDIEKQQMLHRHGDYWVEYQIKARDGSEWLVLCDLATGGILREQKLVNDAP